VLVAEIADLPPVAGDHGGRNEISELGDKKFFRCVANLRGIVDHQGLGMQPLQNMGGGDIGHVERRVLAHQHHIRRRQVVNELFAQGEMIAFHCAHIQRPDPRRHLVFAEGKIAGAVIEDAVATLLRFQQQGERGIAADVNFLDWVHLDRNGQCHLIPLIVRTPHILEMPGKTRHRNHVKAGPAHLKPRAAGEI